MLAFEKAGIKKMRFVYSYIFMSSMPCICGCGRDTAGKDVAAPLYSVAVRCLSLEPLQAGVATL